MKRKKFKIYFDRDRFYLYPWYFADECLTKDIEPAYGKKTSKIILEFKKGHVYYYGIAQELDELGKLLFNKIKKDKKFYKLVGKNIYKYSKKLISFCKNIKSKELPGLPSQSLLNLYLEYQILMRKLRIWGWVPVVIDGLGTSFLSDYVVENLRRFLVKKNLEEKTGEYYSLLSSPDQLSEVRKEEVDRLKLILNIEHSNRAVIKIIKKLPIRKAIIKIQHDFPLIYQKLKKHRKKYEWLPYYYIGPVMSIEDVLQMMKESLETKLSIRGQMKKNREHFRKLPHQREKLIKKLKLPQELQYLLEVSKFFMWFKDYRKGIYQQSYVLMDPVIEEIGRRLNLSISEVKYLTSDELRRALIQRKIDQKKAKQRLQYCIAMISEGKTAVYEGQKAKRHKKYLRESLTATKEFTTGMKELKGMIAYSGKVRGIAKIIAVKADVEKMREGDILVSPATNPDLISAMKKASAFVTDEGGIICHAAIVSREMKKPCIVGTKIATKVLKDGMKIEVDAVRGTVKILS